MNGSLRERCLDPLVIQQLPILSCEQIAIYLSLPSVPAVRMWAKRAGLIPLRLGRAVRYTRLDIDRAIGLTHRR